MKTVSFKSEGLILKGQLYLPPNFDESKRYPAIICSGSWTTVKEQMAGLYANEFAKKGYLTLAFDFRNYGESEGEPRAWENPKMKVEDIINASIYLKSLDFIDSTKINSFGVCAGAMYTLMAAAKDDTFNAIATAASWLHDSDAVTLFYGGKDGVDSKINMAKQAKLNYAKTGIVDYIKTISTTDESAAMYGEFDYYLNPERGALPQWSANKFAVASWEDWLTLNPFPSAKNLNNPLLMIHSDGCVLPDYTKKYYNNVKSKDKELHWIETDLQSPMHQFNFYDQEDEVQLVVNKVHSFFEAH